jgi:hypothetical protein
MDGMLGLLCSAGFVLGIVTVVGHGMWVVLAKLFKAESLDPAELVPADHINCPTCHAALPGSRRLCPACGWPLRPSSDAPASVGLDAVLRELQRLERLQLLDPATAARLTATVRQEQAKLAAASVSPITLAPAARPAALEQPEVLEVLTLAPASSPAPESPRPAPVHTPNELATDVSERVQAYTQQRHTALAATAEVEPLAPPATPWSQLLIHFMEEKNIRWGELIGGLLIVCCSIALVISFWSKIAERPFLKFFVFNGVTAGLFGLGFYIHRRWNLRTTSRGLLTIGTLLVPLNFLAIAAFSEGATPASPWMISGELISIVLFSALVYGAARIIAARAPIAMALGVVGCAVSELLVRRFVAPGAELAIIAGMACLPLACYLGAVGTIVQRARRWPEWGEAEVGELLELLGTVSFAAGVTLGLLLVKTGAVWETLCQLAPLASTSGVPALAVGLLIMQRLKQVELAGVRTAATSIAVLGAGVLLAGLVLGWTNPASLVLVGITDFVVFAAVGLAFEIPAAQLLAAAALVPAWLTVFHVMAGHMGWHRATRADMAHAMLSAASGSSLVPLVALIGGLSWWLARGVRAAHGRFFAIAAAAIAVLSLVLVIGFGFGRSPDAGATWIVLFYAAIALAAGMRVGPAAVWIGSALLLTAIVQGVVFRYADWLGCREPWVVALLAHSSLMTLAAAAGFRSRAQSAGRWDALRHSALASSLAAVPLIAGLLRSETPGAVAGYSFWLAADWFALAWLAGSQRLFTAFQAALSLGVALAAASWIPAQGWLDPRRLQAQGIALTLLNGGWIAVRLSARRLPAVIRTLLFPPWPTLDRWLTGVLIAGLLVLACYGALPGVAHELTHPSAAAQLNDSLGALSLPGMFSEDALGLGTWLLMLALVAVLAARQWEAFRPLAVLAAMLVVWAVCPLVAGHFADASASALRWSAAGYALLLSLPIWFRGNVFRLAQRAAWPQMESRCTRLAEPATWLLLVLGVFPVLLLTTIPALAAIVGNPLIGPGPGSFFARIGNFSAFMVPLGLVFATLVGHAVRERSSIYAFAAGLVLNLATSLGFALSVVTVGGSFGTTECFRLMQFNALAAGSFALAWLAVVSWWSRRQQELERSQPNVLFTLQTALGAAVMALLIGPNVISLFARPTSGTSFFEAAGPWGWLASLVAFAAPVWFTLRFVEIARLCSRLADLLAAALLTAASLAAFEASRWDVGNWLAYHTLLLSFTVVAWLLLGADVWLRLVKQPPAAVRWTGLVGSLVFVLAIRASVSDPERPWWSVGAFVALVPVAAGLSWVVARQQFLWIAAGLLNLATTIWWIEKPLWQPIPPSFHATLLALLEVNAIALALPAVAWLIVDLRFGNRRASSQSAAMHNLAAAGALVILASVTAISLAADLKSSPLPASVLLNGLTIGAVALAIVACLWDARARWPIAGLYVLGFVLLAAVVDGCNLSPRWLVWTGMMLAAAYCLATSYFWSRRRGLLAIADWLAIPRREGPAFSGLAWLVPANWLLAVAVMIACFGVELTFPEKPLRLLSGNAAILQAIAVGMLARGRRRSQLRDASLAFAVLGAVAWGWAWIDPASPARLLDRAVVVSVALGAMSVAYGLGSKFLPPSAWTQSARRMLPNLLALGGVSLCAVLAMEVHGYATHGHVVIAWPAIVAVVLALAALAGAALVAALVPGRDPLRLSERGRTIYVYAAEGLLALLLLHVRLTLPWLFHGLFLRYWPLVVMLVAFAGVGLAELFRRKRHAVLAEPLERTGVLLPLLPVLGYWVAPVTGVHYSLQLLAVGMLYAILSVTRRSFGFGLLAALAANGGLWFFLNEQGQYGLLVHPQLWLIPPALSVLVAAYLNRDRLDDDQITTIRYLSAITIYVSSTADIFLNGVAQAPWLPFVLAGISLAGVVLGIMLQVRAFLFLGTAFLVLSLFTMIWHAAVDLEQTWLWAVSGIVTGVLIIAVFAAFEKKRDDVLVLVERLKDWDA